MSDPFSRRYGLIPTTRPIIYIDRGQLQLDEHFLHHVAVEWEVTKTIRHGRLPIRVESMVCNAGIEVCTWSAEIAPGLWVAGEL